jgi:site-specific DNA recombinase
MKYIRYRRKSSEQYEKQALSIESQKIELDKKFSDLEIVADFEESKSAFTPHNRRKFESMIEMIQKGQADGIIAWHPDRLSRNEIDAATITYLVRTGVIKDLKFGCYYFDNSPEGIMMLQTALSHSQYTSARLGKDVKRGLMTKVEKGWYPVVAPIGYLNTPDKEKGFKTIIKDRQRFPIIRKIWDLMLTGSYTPPQILEIANNEWGLRTKKFRRQGGNPLSRSGIYRLFTNPFYYGWFEFNGKLYKGNHEPMVTKEESDKVQIILGRKGRPRLQTHHFPFTGMIRCGECGCLITAETKTKFYPTTKHLANYTYYHCTKKKRDVKCHQKPIREDDLENQIDILLAKIQISEVFKGWALKYLHEIHEQETDDRTTIYKSLQEAYNVVQNKLNNLLDLKIRELISDDEYTQKKEVLLKEQANLKEKLEDTESRASSWLELSEKAFNFACYARYWFRNGALEEKKTILQTIGSDFVLKDGKLSIQLQEPYFIIQDANEHEEKYAKRLELPKKLVLSPQIRDLALQNPTWLRR